MAQKRQLVIATALYDTLYAMWNDLKVCFDVWINTSIWFWHFVQINTLASTSWRYMLRSKVVMASYSRNTGWRSWSDTEIWLCTFFVCEVTILLQRRKILWIDHSFRIQWQIFILAPLNRVMLPKYPNFLTVFSRKWSF